MIERIIIGTPEDAPNIEARIEALKALFAEAENTLEHEGREKAKVLTGPIYAELRRLNQPNIPHWSAEWEWNKDGSLTESQFDELNLRRKKLSNAIGIKTATGIRHDLYKI